MWKESIADRQSTVMRTSESTWSDCKRQNVKYSIVCSLEHCHESSDALDLLRGLSSSHTLLHTDTYIQSQPVSFRVRCLTTNSIMCVCQLCLIRELPYKRVEFLSVPVHAQKISPLIIEDRIFFSLLLYIITSLRYASTLQSCTKVLTLVVFILFSLQSF